MADIHALPEKKPVNSDAVEKLEALLAQVRSGEVASFVAAGFRPNGMWFTTYSGQIDTLGKIGALEAIKLDLLNSLNL